MNKSIAINLIANGVKNPFNHNGGMVTVHRFVCWANGLSCRNEIIISLNMVNINMQLMQLGYRTRL